MQKTIKKEMSYKGIGIHTGSRVSVQFRPAEPDTGIVFIRTDMPGKPTINLREAKVLDSSYSPRRTSISQNGATVETIEHTLAVLCGLEIDNLIIEIDGPEMPGADGSAQEFVNLFSQAGMAEQDAPDRVFGVSEPLFCEDRNASIVVLPSDQFKISYTLKFNLPYMPPQYYSVSLNEKTFTDEIAPSRTFCVEEWVKDLRKEGLGKGADYNNTLVIDRRGTIVKNELRFKDELARHKILDLMGDLFLTGRRLKGHFIAVKSGHALNIKLAKMLKDKIRDNSQTAQKAQGEDNILLDKEQIKKILPHRDPFLFVDEIIKIEEGKSATGVKYLAKDDYFYKGHFPGHPVTPGVIIIEALAQVGGVLMLGKKDNMGKIAYFMCIDKAKFRKAVYPPAKLFLEVEITRFKTKTGQLKGKAKVNSQVVAEAELMFSLV
jgi:UDP-3-O-[3-hydroxymyristoyl] N-acetylglucosamine deacetylase/3-hydroxyacyl-[acyl-carrier-protein] dehydratase